MHLPRCKPRLLPLPMRSRLLTILQWVQVTYCQHFAVCRHTSGFLARRGMEFRMFEEGHGADRRFRTQIWDTTKQRLVATGIHVKTGSNDGHEPKPKL